MKRLLALLTLLLFLTPFALADGAPFAYSDLRVGELLPGATSAQAVTAFGEPAATETLVKTETEDMIDCYRYDGLSLFFAQDALYRAEWTREDIEGVRGLTVGAATERVIDLFYRDYSQKETYILYESGRLDTGLYLPPLGVIGSDGNTVTVCYQAPVDKYPEAVRQDTQNYAATPHATVCFEADKESGRVTRIWWSVGELE